MKRNFFYAMMFCFASTLFSQEKGTHEIKFNVGFETSNEFLNTVDDIISGASYQNTSVTPAFSVTYKVAIKNNWFLFADGNYQSISEDVIENNSKTGDVSHRYLTFGFGSDYHYISNSWFQMYSGLSVGYTSQNSDFTTSSNIEDENDSFFNFHLNALGFRFGKTIAATLELGVGYRGVANLGLSYQF